MLTPRSQKEEIFFKKRGELAVASQAASLVPSRSPSRSVSPVPGYRMMQNRSSRPHSAAPGTKTHHKTEPASPVINLRNLISMEPPEGPRTPKLAANFGCKNDIFSYTCYMRVSIYMYIYNVHVKGSVWRSLCVMMWLERHFDVDT